MGGATVKTRKFGLIRYLYEWATSPSKSWRDTVLAALVLWVTLFAMILLFKECVGR